MQCKSSSTDLSANRVYQNDCMPTHSQKQAIGKSKTGARNKPSNRSRGHINMMRIKRSDCALSNFEWCRLVVVLVALNSAPLSALAFNSNNQPELPQTNQQQQTLSPQLFNGLNQNTPYQPLVNQSVTAQQSPNDQTLTQTVQLRPKHQTGGPQVTNSPSSAPTVNVSAIAGHLSEPTQRDYTNSHSLDTTPVVSVSTETSRVQSMRDEVAPSSPAPQTTVATTRKHSEQPTTSQSPTTTTPVAKLQETPVERQGAAAEHEVVRPAPSGRMLDLAGQDSSIAPEIQKSCLLLGKEIKDGETVSETMQPRTSDDDQNGDGCERICTCVDGRILCESTCPPLSDVPPSDLDCVDSVKTIVTIGCCPRWACQREELYALRSLTAVPTSPTVVNITIGLPDFALEQRGRIELNYTSRPPTTSRLVGADPDDELPPAGATWLSRAKIRTTNGVFSNRFISYNWHSLKPGHKYWFKVLVHLENSPDAAPIESALQSITMPQFPATTTTITTTSTPLITMVPVMKETATTTPKLITTTTTSASPTTATIKTTTSVPLVTMVPIMKDITTTTTTTTPKTSTATATSASSTTTTATPQPTTVSTTTTTTVTLPTTRAPATTTTTVTLPTTRAPTTTTTTARPNVTSTTETTDSYSSSTSTSISTKRPQGEFKKPGVGQFDDELPPTNDISKDPMAEPSQIQNSTIYPPTIISIIAEQVRIERYAWHLLVALSVMTVLFIIVSYLYCKKSRVIAPITSPHYPHHHQGHLGHHHQSAYDNPTFTKLVSYYANQPHVLLVDESNQNFDNLAKQKNMEVDKSSPLNNSNHNQTSQAPNHRHITTPVHHNQNSRQHLI